MQKLHSTFALSLENRSWWILGRGELLLFFKLLEVTIGIIKAINVWENQGLPVPTVGTSMAVKITHVFLWDSRATNHIENALMGSPWVAIFYILTFFIK